MKRSAHREKKIVFVLLKVSMMKMAACYLFLVLIYVLHISVEGAITYTSTYGGTSVSKAVGSSVTFSWRFSGALANAKWGIKSSGINDIKTVLVYVDQSGMVPVIPAVPDAYIGRVSGIFAGDSSSGQVDFTLTNITKDDETSFGCILEGTLTLQTKFDAVRLVVEVPSNITHISENQRVNDGNEVILNCTADGKPKPNITWTRVSDNSVVTFPLTVGKVDSGVYRCTADNGIGNPTTADVSITVQYPATIRSATPPVSESWIGQNVTLTCKSDGVPTPSLIWYKPDGTKFSTVTSKENTAVVTMNFDSDFGLYNCTAENGFVPASKTVFVQQIKAPGSPIITSKDGDIQATFMTVKWDPPANNGGSPITAHRVVILQSDVEIRKKNVTVTDSDAGSWLIKNLSKSTNYTVKVFARNYVFEGNATEKTFQTKFKGIPSAVDIIDLPPDVKEGNVTIKWNTPKDNGEPITLYTVYRRTVSEDGTPQEWITIKKIKDVFNRVVVVSLNKGKKYEFVVTATNDEGESLKEKDKIKGIAVGDIPEAVVITDEVNDVDITLTWEEPDNNGANITQYDVYQGIVNDKWKKIETIKDTSKRKFVFEGKNGEEYKFAVTATNIYGESSKEDSSTIVKVPEGTDPGTGADTQSGGMNTPIIAGAAAVGVLLIIGLIIFAVWWKRRKTPRDDASSSGTALRSGNEIEDGYQDVSPAAAAQRLQASGPVAEPNYAEVNVSQKKKNRRPVIDEYAQVDRSKKTKKKPKKQPGELDYAELDDLRPRPQPAPVPSGANARPVVRPPAYEGTLYADIAQFGVPQPEPTYDNMPRKDVVYSNVESM